MSFISLPATDKDRLYDAVINTDNVTLCIASPWNENHSIVHFTGGQWASTVVTLSLAQLKSRLLSER